MNGKGSPNLQNGTRRRSESRSSQTKLSSIVHETCYLKRPESGLLTSQRFHCRGLNSLCDSYIHTEQSFRIPGSIFLHCISRLCRDTPCSCSTKLVGNQFTLILQLWQPMATASCKAKGRPALAPRTSTQTL
jgi:hypothetical protein